MPETPTFVVNDRRKFTSEGELRHEGAASTDLPSTDEEQAKGPHLVTPEPASVTPLAELSDLPESEAIGALEDQPLGSTEANPLASVDDFSDDPLPPGPTEEQIAEATRAYDATVDRLDTALRAADPGGERMPEMSFERLTQSLYTQALMLLGGAAQPGETPRVDILGARQTIDMLSIIGQKSAGNLSEDEDKLLQSALFDLRMGFLEITQALARQAAQRQAGGPGGPGSLGGPPPGSGPRIVR